ncbi:TetR/AcrR family transcriptional regulator [Cellulomonas sp. KRMCY2]|uniref:TetR/AcrR family transcriptional regulator n=1 Tax=Cellulomonas sp. KRMCY2 TaxID=1304865 RepID=UPI00045EA7E5|nr:TetR/AcrR family transcriptional regulator [Cellulomonas sp. KRMCY2]
MTDKHRSPQGRPPVTSAAQIASVALELFARQGYDATTLADVAGQVGVGRSTLFRYFESKSAIVWHGRLEAEQALLAELGHAEPGPAWRPQVARCLMAALRFPGDDTHALRLRLRLIDSTPSLRTHLHTTAEPAVAAIADVIARSTDRPAGDLEPVVLARTLWWATIEALIWWAVAGTGTPEASVGRALVALGFDPTESARTL